MTGRRLPDETPPYDYEPGDFGRYKGHWWFRAPDGKMPAGKIKGRGWTVEEHGDGTITVTPSLDLGPGQFHGHLTAGAWS